MRTFVTTLAIAFGVAFAATNIMADERGKGGDGGGGVGAHVEAGGGGAKVSAGAHEAANVDGAKVEGAHEAAKVETNREAAKVEANKVQVNNERARDAARLEANHNGARVETNRANINVNGAQVDVNARAGANAELNRKLNQNDRITINNGRQNMIGSQAFVDRNARLGDRDFDRRNIGRLDDTRFANSRDNNWRFRRWGNEWWYWLPTGSWMYWRDGRWNAYDMNNYAYDNGAGYSDYAPDQGYAQPSQVNANFNGPYYEDQNGFYYMNGNQRVYDSQIRRVTGEVGTLPAPTTR